MSKYYFNRISIKKNSIVFTWDDNFESHYKIIAPIFMDYKYYCTFYINPGESTFLKNFYNGYKLINDLGFELGSHGFTHHHYSRITASEFSCQLSKSKELMQYLFAKSPSTFAFPHHDFNDKMLDVAREVYFETRNTLYNAKRFSLKSETKLSEVKAKMLDAISNKYSIIFSGHSILDSTIERKKCGYEPIRICDLVNILSLVSKYPEIQVCTFEQAALKAYITNKCYHTDTYFTLDDIQSEFLRKYGLRKERINEIV